MQQSPSEALLGTLLTSGVLEETDGSIGLTEEFRSQYEKQEPERVGTDFEGDSERRVAGYARALRAIGVPLDEPEIDAAARSLASLARDDGPFVRVPGERLPEFLETHRRALVLVTKAGCTPCEKVRAKLDELVAAGTVPDDVVLVDVPGAEAQRLLWEEFDVVGAPTLLFYRRGRIEMRLTGNPHTEQLRSDVQRVYA